MFVSDLECPGGTVYDPCASPCQPSCGNTTQDDCIGSACIETCRCPEGQLLDGDHCVDPSNCGCTLDNGMYFPVSDASFCSYYNFYLQTSI